jgi:CheY-like chemotaxis protein
VLTGCAAMSPIKPVVLVVEDDFLLLVDARMALEDAGFDVIEASDAEAALRQFMTRTDIAAIVSDVSMPGAIDGIGLARAARALKPQLPIVLTTGMADTPDAPDGVRILLKPYRAWQLAEQIGPAELRVA